MKRCTKCGEEKERGEFCKDMSKKDGLFCMCRKCLSAYKSSRLSVAKASGSCFLCGNPARSGRSRCEPCSKKKKGYDASRTAIARDGGPCRECGENPARLGKKDCEQCAARERWRKIKRKYGLSKEDFYALLEAQELACAICKKVKHTEEEPLLHVDHDHTTGDVRELLCLLCNSGIGKFNEDPETLESAIAYLKKHKKAA